MEELNGTPAKKMKTSHPPSAFDEIATVSDYLNDLKQLVAISNNNSTNKLSEKHLQQLTLFHLSQYTQASYSNNILYSFSFILSSSFSSFLPISFTQPILIMPR